MNTMENGINRRAFVGAAGIGLAALAGFGALGQRAFGEEAAGESAAETAQDAPKAAEAANGGAVPQVYFTHDISPEGLMRTFEALGVQPQGNVAVKLSTGEPGGHNFLQPDLIADLVHALDATIVECTTAYGGPRSTVEGGMQTAEDHGFTAIADVDIMDADGSLSLPVELPAEIEGHLAEDLVGTHLADYDYVAVSYTHLTLPTNSRV